MLCRYGGQVLDFGIIFHLLVGHFQCPFYMWCMWTSSGLLSVSAFWLVHRVLFCLSLPSTFCHIPTVGFLSFPQASLQRIWPFGRVYNAYGVVVSMEHKQCGIILRIAEHEIAIQWFIQYVYSSTFVLESSSFSTFKSTLEKQFTLVLHEISSMDLCQEGLHEDLTPELASETVS